MVAVLFVLSALCVLASMLGWMNFSFLSRIPEYTVVPVKNFFEKTAEAVRVVFVDSAQIEAENVRLGRRIDQLEAELAAMSGVNEENERLRRLLGLAERVEYEFAGADVVAMMPGNWFTSFTIDAGTADGIDAGMPVIVGDGLVGVVREASTDTSLVRAVINTASATAVIVERTRDHGVARGVLAADGTYILEMSYLSSLTELQIGDRVLTSGMDAVYPEGLLVGAISEISRDGSGKGYVHIAPAVDFLHVDEVLVLRTVAPAGE